MRDMHAILDEMSELEREINNCAKGNRAMIVAELLRRGYDEPGQLLIVADRLCHFIEHGTKIEPAKSQAPFASVQPVKKRRGRPPNSSAKPAKGKTKRKYTKRSAHWKK